MHRFNEDIKKLIEEIAIEKNLKDGFTVKSEDQSFTGDNYTGAITRIKVEGVDTLKGSTKTIDLFIKRSLDDQKMRSEVPIQLIYKREIDSYEKVLPTLYKLQKRYGIEANERFSFPKFYKAIPDEFKETLILDDLSSEGYKMYNRMIPFDYDHICLVMQNLARFHATSFAMKQSDPKTFGELSELLASTNELGSDGFVKMIRKCFDSYIPTIQDPETKERVAKFNEGFVEYMNYALSAEAAYPYDIICHGDCWTNNMLFKYSDDKVADVVFIDYQIMRLASPVIDIAYVIFLSTDQECRRKHLHSLLDIYYNTLEKNVSRMGCDIAECYPRSVFEDHQKKFMKYGLLLGIFSILFVFTKPEDAKTLGNLFEEADKGELQVTLTEQVLDMVNKVVGDMVYFNYF